MKKRTSNAKRYYLAYGSNLNTVEMKYRCPSAKVIGTAEISGWRLLFRGNWMGYLTIEPCEGACVPVALWEVSPDDESSLDSYEGFPDFYDKQDMRLPVRETGSRETSERDAFIYITGSNKFTLIDRQLNMLKMHVMEPLKAQTVEKA